MLSIKGLERKPVSSLWLRDTYATIRDEPLMKLQGPLNVSERLLEWHPSDDNVFISSGDLFRHLSGNMNQEVCEQTITFVIRGLRDRYWHNKASMSLEDVIDLTLVMDEPLPLMELARSDFDIPLFKMFGTITRFSVLHISVGEFVRMLGENGTITFNSQYMPMIVELHYEKSDFWDPTSGSLVELTTSC